MTKKHVFFDLDGTLTDPKMGITRCIQFAMDKLGHEAVATKKLLWCIGPPLLGSFKELVGPDQAEEAVQLYRERFSEIGLFENEVYDGVPEVLSTLIGRGFELHVASSKPKVYVDRILEHFNLSQYFTQVFGAELDGTRSDKTELLSYALSETGAKPDESTMIGDRKHDCLGATNNNMGLIGVLYGYGAETELREHGATRLASNPEAVLKHFS